MVTKRRMPRVALCALILVLALGATAVVYTAWAQSLQVNGDVSTGTLRGEWTQMGCWEDPEFGGRDVAHVTWDVNQADATKAWVTLSNAYPGYSAHCSLSYNNAGTIPLWVKDVVLTPRDHLTSCVPWTNNGNGSFWADCGPFKVQWRDGVNSIINPDDQVGESGTLDIYVRNTDVPDYNTDYTFDMSILLEQWNLKP